MPAANSFDYAIVRVVPRVERGEFINAGAILFCRTLRYLGAAIELDRARLLALAPTVDIDEVERHLATIQLICAGDAGGGPIAKLSMAERFHWLVAPRSTLIQTSPAHSGLDSDPETVLRHLVDTMVRAPR
ncbi:MAG: hypothetical protein JWO59_1659 [Chloroflexi bacterium]|nr:hypothetical protein [Chloroflexota bacterium]